MSITNSNALVHTFYIWPQMGLNLSEQWGKVRENFENLHPLAKAAQLALDAAENHEPKNNDLSGLAIGERDFRNRWRTWYDPTRDRYAIQFNQGTEAQPVWDDFLTVRDSDGRVTVHGTGGIDSSIGGFYSPLPRNLAVSAAFTPASFEWQFQHNLNTKPILWDAYNLEDKSVTPLTVDVSDPNVAYFYFAIATAGRAIAVAEQARGEGIRITDGTNTYEGSTRLGFNIDDFYLTKDSYGKPVVNLQPIDQASIDHGSISGLTDDDHTQYLRTDGTRALTGNQSAGNNKITNLATPTANADAVTKVYADSLVVGGSMVKVEDSDGQFFNTNTIIFNKESDHIIGFYITPNSSGKPVINIRGGDNHDELKGLLDDDHTQYLRTDGTRALTGNQSADNFKITNLGQPTADSDAVRLQDIGPGFYGLTVKQTGTPNVSFRGIKVIEFDRGGFYLGQNSPNTDTVVISTARDKISITDGRLAYSTDHVGFNHNQFYLSSGSQGKPVVNISSSYAPNGCVTMIRSADSNNLTTISAAWVVFNERGEPMSSAGSTSEGLQEAINYAAFHGYDLKVYGGGIATKNGQDVAIINCTNQITVPPVQGVDWQIHATINFGGSPSGTPAGVLFDSVMASDISFRGQIVVPSSYTFGVRFAPISELPQDPNGPVVTSSTIRLPSVVKVGGIAIELDCSAGGISSNFFEFTEPNGGDTGVRVLPGSGFSFDNNETRIVDCHAQSTCINAGFSNALGNNCFGNIWSVQCDPLVGGVGIEIFSKNDHFNASITNLEGLPTNGVTLNNAASRNIIIFRKNDATNAYNDASSTGDNIIIIAPNTASQAVNFGGQKLSNMGAPTVNTDTARLGDIAFTLSDGVRSFVTQSPARTIRFNQNDFYLTKESSSTPQLNLR